MYKYPILFRKTGDEMTTYPDHRRTLQHVAGRLTALMCVWLLSSGAAIAGQGTELRWEIRGRDAR